MEPSKPNVHPLTDTQVIQIDEVDARFAAEQLGAVEKLHAAIGEEVEQHEARKSELLAHLHEARREYATAVKTLTKKYIKEPGKFEFRAELGAFIGVRTPPAGGRAEGE